MWTDDTGVTIKVDCERNSRKSHVWVYPGHGGQVFYDRTESRSRDGPLEVLRDFEGYLQADALEVHDGFFKSGAILEVACWAHARRRFVDAEGQEPEFARQAIDRVRELYAIERAAKEAGLDTDGVRALRRVAVGRRNWIFFGNERGGRTAAILYSLIATCHEHGIDPRVYLRDALLELQAGAYPRT